MRSDALRNRERLMEAADRMFREHGFDVTVGEIADAAEVGRATLFRNFPTKEDLIAAVAVENMKDAVAFGERILSEPENDAEAVYTFIGEVVGRQQANRAMMEAITEEFKMRPDVTACHEAIHNVLEQALERGKRAGSVRPEIVPSDVIILIKGLCASLQMLSAENGDVFTRHLELIRAAISTPAYARPLQGEPAVF